jgi:hypothetical protein
VQKAAMAGLTNLGVNIKLFTKVISASTNSTGQTEVVYFDGSKTITDFYIPTFGVIPNSSFIPSKLLDKRGFAIVDEHLKIKGANDIWAVGDINNVEWAQWIYMDFQSQYLSKQITSILKGKTPVPYKLSTDSTRTFVLLILLHFTPLAPRLHKYPLPNNTILISSPLSQVYWVSPSVATTPLEPSDTGKSLPSC